MNDLYVPDWVRASRDGLMGDVEQFMDYIRSGEAAYDWNRLVSWNILNDTKAFQFQLSILQGYDTAA